MFETINRDVLIITPKQGLIDWVNSIFPESPVTMESFGKNDHSNVYLIPETDHPDLAIKYLKKNLKIYLENELFDWCTDEECWPKQLNWELFEKWFDYSIQTMVFDMGKGPIIKENY